MTLIADPVVEAYAEAHTSPPPPHLARLAEETRAGMDAPQMMVGALEGRFLEVLVHATGARRVLEIGTFTGYSALSMAAGLPEEGRIITCEANPRHAEVARRHVAANGLEDRIEVRQGPALETLATLAGPFDLVFIDADKPAYLAYYEAVLPKLAPLGLIVVDNTLWSGQVADEEDVAEDTVSLRAFNDHVVADPRVSCVQLTVRDGITLIRRRHESQGPRHRPG
ncbi:MAG TPA: class I SAM-dependent methyltransferase [Acidimicrobiales bacterium]|nr:class I SAM-dependent methyltransferase [Acidimicrobiales bacterium]